MKEGLVSAYSEPALMPYDETSTVLSPRIRKHPMTYFIYPGLDPHNLKGFLLHHQASTACIQKAMTDLGTVTPATSLRNLGDDLSPSSSISDDVFIDDVIEQTTDHDDTAVFQEMMADSTILDEVPLESEADDTLPAGQTPVPNHKLSNKSAAFSSVSSLKPLKKKGLNRFFVALCSCGGFKSRKQKQKNLRSPTTEL